MPRHLLLLLATLTAASPPRAIERDDFKPAVIRFGASLADLKRDLAGPCRTLMTRQIGVPFRVFRDEIKDKQHQIDCDGLLFRGKPRWVEFVIADDKLEMVWILTDSTDERSLRAAMTAAYGPSDVGNAKFAAFTSGRAALRTDKPEVLFYSERVAPKVLAWFGPNSTF